MSALKNTLSDAITRPVQQKHNRRMINRIRDFRKRAKLTQIALAELLSVDKTTVYRYETGVTPPFNETFLKIAEALGVKNPIDLLVLGEASDASQAPLVGYVGAGAQVFPLDDGHERVESPPGLKNPIAVRVRSSLMAPAYWSGDILFCEQEAVSRDQLIGRDCIVQVEGGPRFLKRVLKGGAPSTFRLFSYETQDVGDDVYLTMGTPVKWVQRA